MYKNYGTIDYNGINIQDITTRYIISAKFNESNTSMIIDYIIKDWESPETIAHKLYGSCDYAWIILLVNNIINPYTDWLRTNDEMEEYIFNKYGSNLNDIHHYEYNGLIYYDPIIGSTPVTNSEYEYDKNEKKRKIKVIPPEYLSQVENMLLSKV